MKRDPVYFDHISNSKAYDSVSRKNNSDNFLSILADDRFLYSSIMTKE